MHDPIARERSPLETARSTLLAHAAHVRATLEDLRKAKLHVKQGKEEWLVERTTFLGFGMGVNGTVHLTDDSVNALKEIGLPRNTTELRSW